MADVHTQMFASAFSRKPAGRPKPLDSVIAASHDDGRLGLNRRDGLVNGKLLDRGRHRAVIFDCGCFVGSGKEAGAIALTPPESGSLIGR